MSHLPANIFKNVGFDVALKILDVFSHPFLDVYRLGRVNIQE